MRFNEKTGALHTEDLESPNISTVDTNADGNTYYGSAVPGSATSSAVWQVQRMSVSGAVQTFKYANGSTSFANIWDNRTSLTYS